MIFSCDSARKQRSRFLQMWNGYLEIAGYNIKNAAIQSKPKRSNNNIKSADLLVTNSFRLLHSAVLSSASPCYTQVLIWHCCLDAWLCWVPRHNGPVIYGQHYDVTGGGGGGISRRFVSQETVVCVLLRPLCFALFHALFNLLFSLAV